MDVSFLFESFVCFISLQPPRYDTLEEEKQC